MPEPENAGRATPRRRLITRRAITRGAALAVPVAVGMRIAAAQSTPPSSLDPAAVAADIAAMNLLLTFEHVLAALYDDALMTFDANAMLAVTKDSAVRLALEQARDDEVTHASTLASFVTDLGGTPSAAARYVWGYAGVQDMLETARSLENSAAAAYGGAIPLVSTPDAITALIGIHSVEARHAAYLADHTGAPAYPDPIDQPLNADDVAAILSPFVVGGLTIAVASPVAAVAVTPTPEPPATPAPTGTPAPAVAEATASPTATKRPKHRTKTQPAGTPAAKGSKSVKGAKNAKKKKTAKGGKKTVTPAAQQPATPPTPTPSASSSSVGTATQASFGGTPGLDSVIADAAKRWGVPADQIEVVSNEPHEWSSAALGCPKPGEMYAQVITPGYVVLLQTGDQRIEYHLDTKGNFVDCEST
jgi:bacterioferritin (cytochrome b1)